ncbi:MAG: hypothetical protein N2235_00125 [Fischerella sp.]|nr:hypothetical protein [Fischerella sp.]
MAKHIQGSDNFQILPSQMELEFLEALLQPEDSTYPWNPTDEHSEEYFLQLEQQFLLEDALADELTGRSQAFHNKIEMLWVSAAAYYKCNTKSHLVARLQESLQTSFATRVPQDWLKAIATKAADVFVAKQSIAEQLVECVQAVLPGWGADDLLVLARPYAYAMRSSEPQNENRESVLNQVGEQEWTNLSEIEQARASLAIAYYALRELDSIQGEGEA